MVHSPWPSVPPELPLTGVHPGPMPAVGLGGGGGASGPASDPPLLDEDGLPGEASKEAAPSNIMVDESADTPPNDGPCDKPLSDPTVEGLPPHEVSTTATTLEQLPAATAIISAGELCRNL